MKSRIYPAIPFLLALALLLALSPSAPAQNPAQSPDRLAGTTANLLHWNVPADPVKIAGPLYFVGTKGLAFWLFATPEGHILLNTGMPPSGEMIEASIRKLGFKPEDIKILLACHAHVDHAGAHAHMQKVSGAKVIVMEAEKPLLESGGKTDFHYGKNPLFQFKPVKVDRTLKDGETVEFGGVVLTAHHTPGHTKGSTTWTTTLEGGGKSYFVVFSDGTSVNPGYRLVKDPSYPGIADDYRLAFETLESLKPDIWLSAHNEMFGFESKRARAASEGPSAWIDPDGYKKFISSARAKFEAQVKAELPMSEDGKKEPKST